MNIKLLGAAGMLVAAFSTAAVAQGGTTGSFAAYQKGMKALQGGDVRQAYLHFQKAVRSTPVISDAFFHMGNIEAQAGKMGNAIRSWGNVLEKSGTYPLAQARLGMVFMGMRKYKEAAGHFKNAATKAPSLRAWIQTAEAQINARLYTDAQESIEKAGKMGRPGYRMYDLQARLYFETKEYQKAFDLWAKVVKMTPRDPRIRHLQAQALERLKKKDEAVKLYEGVLKLGPYLPTIDRLLKIYKDDPSKQERVEDLMDLREKARKKKPRRLPAKEKRGG